MRFDRSGPKGQFGAHMIAHRPSDDLAGREIEHGCEKQPSLAGRDVGDIGEPDAVRGGRDKLLLQQVRGYRLIVADGSIKLSGDRAAEEDFITRCPLPTKLA